MVEVIVILVMQIDQLVEYVEQKRKIVLCELQQVGILLQILGFVSEKIDDKMQVVNYMQVV